MVEVSAKPTPIDMKEDAPPCNTSICHKTKQKDKTISFWDDYYNNMASASTTAASLENGKAKDKYDSTSCSDVSGGVVADGGPTQEWILKNTPELLNRICSFLPQSCDVPMDGDVKTNAISSTKLRRVELLEIGCGNSQLSRSLWEHLKAQEQEQPKYTPHPNELSGTCKINKKDGAATHYHVTATDVSHVCIKQIMERDADFISNDSSSNNNSIGNGGILRYEMLDVLSNDVTSFGPLGGFDMVFDKGCLDTFLFRNGMSDKTTRHPPLLRTLLDNVHRLLCDDAGVYVIITPRARIKSVRDFSGFSSVKRIKIDAEAMGRGDLDGKNKSSVSSSCENATTAAACITDAVYMHVCTKDKHYKPGISSPFMDMYDTSLQNDTSNCEKCGITFIDFRAGENMKGKGEKYWARRWKGHQVHCKGVMGVHTI